MIPVLQRPTRIAQRAVAGGGAFSPSSITGLKLWLKGDAAVYNDAGSTLATNTQTVQQWNDQSGGGNNASQGTSGNRPTYVTSGMNGLPSVRFDGDTGTTGSPDYWLSLGNLSALFPSAATLFVAFEPLNSDVGYCAMETHNNDTWWMFGGVGGNGFSGVLRTTRLSSYPASVAGSGRHVWAFLSDGSAYQIYRNGTGAGAQAADFNGGTNWVIGTSNQKFQSKPFNGYIGEVIAYDTVLSSTDRASVEAYIKAKWGTL